MATVPRCACFGLWFTGPFLCEPLCLCSESLWEQQEKHQTLVGGQNDITGSQTTDMRRWLGTASWSRGGAASSGVLVSKGRAKQILLTSGAVVDVRAVVRFELDADSPWTDRKTADVMLSAPHVILGIAPPKSIARETAFLCNFQSRAAVEAKCEVNVHHATSHELQVKMLNVGVLRIATTWRSNHRSPLGLLTNSQSRMDPMSRWGVQTDTGWGYSDRRESLVMVSNADSY